MKHRLSRYNGSYRPPTIRTLGLSFVFVLISTSLFRTGTSLTVTSSQTQASITEWTVPTANSGPWSLELDQSGRCCWFLEYYGNKLGHLDPTSGTFQEWAIPTINANPYGLAITSISGVPVLWGTEFSSGKVFAFFPASGIFREYSIPQYNAGVGFVSIEPPSTQNLARIWFTETLRNGNGEIVYDPTKKNVTLYEDIFPAVVGGGAYGVYAGSGSVWFAGFSALARWDRASQQYTMWPLPVHGSAVVGRFVTIDSYGQAWYTQGSINGAGSDNFIGVLRGNGFFQEWRLPTPGSDPRQIILNPVTEQPWVAERSPIAGNGTIAVLSDPYGGTIVPSVSTTAPSRGTLNTLAPNLTSVNPSVNVVSPTINQTEGLSNNQFIEFRLGAAQPQDVLVDSTGNVWASEPAANKIVRISQSSSDFSLTSSLPVISLPQGGSGSVEVTSSSIAGFEGAVTFASTSAPPGVTLAFNPNPLRISPGVNSSAKMVISVATNSPPGTSSIIIQGGYGPAVHFLNILLTVTNSTPSSSQQLRTRCLIAVPIYLPQSTLLSGLLIDVFIVAFYIGLPPEYFSRRLHLLRGLSRRSWLIILLVAPSLLSVGSALFLLC